MSSTIKSAPVLMDMRVVENVPVGKRYNRIKLEPAEGMKLPLILPGQFVQVQSPDKGVMFRRPISVHNVDWKGNTLCLLVAPVGDGTRAICTVSQGEILNVLLPLGNGFCTDANKLNEKEVVLAGGGVGIAPLLYYAQWLKVNTTASVSFVLGARSGADFPDLDAFRTLGELFLTTDNGSLGEKGFAVDSQRFTDKVDFLAVCGPGAMMKSFAAMARDKGIDCEVSLENMMACGLGACLCCVEKTVRGNVCVCTEGPVFNISQLTWS